MKLKNRIEAGKIIDEINKLNITDLEVQIFEKLSPTIKAWDLGWLTEEQIKQAVARITGSKPLLVLIKDKADNCITWLAEEAYYKLHREYLNRISCEYITVRYEKFTSIPTAKAVGIWTTGLW